MSISRWRSSGWTDTYNQRRSSNLWIRDIVYNHHFRSTYGLDRLEPWLEVPLDSHTAAFIRRESVAPLPRWTTIMAVSPTFSGLYQDAARGIVATPRFAYFKHPVHLDLAAWRQED